MVKPCCGDLPQGDLLRQRGGERKLMKESLAATLKRMSTHRQHRPNTDAKRRRIEISSSASEEDREEDDKDWKHTRCDEGEEEEGRA